MKNSSTPPTDISSIDTTAAAVIRHDESPSCPKTPRRESFRRSQKAESSSSMRDVSALMRSEDAELLESIHFSTANGCESPFVHSLPTYHGLSEKIPSLSLEVDDVNMTDNLELALSPKPKYTDGAIISKYSHYKSPVGGTRKTFDRLDRGNVQELDVDDPFKRHALSGEVYNVSLYTPALTELQETIIDHLAVKEERFDETENRSDLRRSESLTRRISEAQQFAEAVGDLLPTEQNKLRIIEDDIQDDSDDEDDEKAIVCPEAQQSEPEREVPVPEELTRPTQIAVRRKSRPTWPFKSPPKRGFMDKLPDAGTQQDFVYKGIRANPPIIVKRGTDRGNYAQLHRKAWLEVSDKYHRYGKHLRVYYRHWESLDCPYNMFFDWLDSKGEAAGQPLPNLPECPRSVVDSDTVLYITSDEVTHGYALSFVSDDEGRGRVFDVDGDPVLTGPDGWIFVLRDNVMYGAEKVTSVQGKSKQRFHHSSFFGGKAVAAAGIFVTDEEGYLTRLYPHSGHYRPGDAHMQRMLFFLHNEGVDLRTFEMDMQQILHVARDAPKDVKETDISDKTDKKKKVETLLLVPAVEVACHLAHKARFIGENIFAQIHQIRKSGAATVSEALAAIDDSGK